jgi:hypothetical protein
MVVQTQTQQKPVSRANPSRMTLGEIVKGKLQEPISVLVYGVEGVGKSTFGADAPAPIFIDGERGTSELDVARFPVPETWGDVRDAIRVLTVGDHKYRSLVIDTLDWLEPMLWEYICKRDEQANIESYGYGKGYAAALDEWRIFLADLERLRAARGMNVILLAHSWIKSFKNPEGDDFDRYELKLHPKAGGLLKEWPKAVLFANFETVAAKDPKNPKGRNTRVRGVSTGARFLYTIRTGVYDAKNRYGLPDKVPLSWLDFSESVKKAQPSSPVDLVSEIKRKAEDLGGDLGKQALSAIDRASGDTTKLSQLNSWCNCRLNEKEEFLNSRSSAQVTHLSDEAELARAHEMADYGSRIDSKR